MPSYGGGHVPLEVFLIPILGILVEFHDDIFMKCRSAARHKVPAVDAGLQRALLPIERRAPGVF